MGRPRKVNPESYSVEFIQPQQGGDVTVEKSTPEIEVGRTYDIPDVFAVKMKNPEVKARWIRDDKRNITEKKQLGFQIANMDDLAPGQHHVAEADGTVRVGDLILAKISKDRSNQILERRHATQRRLLEAQRQGTLRKESRGGVTIREV